MQLRIVEISSIIFYLLTTFSVESDLETTVMNCSALSQEKTPVT
jgi:hypothetical protein